MSARKETMGTVFGVGLGPGDPDLMSVRAHRLIRRARHVAYFHRRGRKGQGFQIAQALLPPAAQMMAMEYPVTTEIPFQDPQYNRLLSAFYDDCAAQIRAITQRGEDVMVLCEGDPFFYGSFMHLYTRLRDDGPVEVVPAITGMSGAWTATGAPITWGDDVLTVVMATLPEDELVRRIGDTDALVVMKIGKNIRKLIRALKANDRFDQAWIVEYATMERQNMAMLRDIDPDTVPYFAIVLIHGEGRRP